MLVALVKLAAGTGSRSPTETSGSKSEPKRHLLGSSRTTTTRFPKEYRGRTTSIKLALPHTVRPPRVSAQTGSSPLT
jgi:hypothetical protein